MVEGPNPGWRNRVTGSLQLHVRGGCTGRRRWGGAWCGLADGCLILRSILGEFGQLGKAIRLGYGKEAKGPFTRERWGGGRTVNVGDATSKARLLQQHCCAQLGNSVY